MRFCVLGSFLLFLINKMRFLARNVCFSVLATIISCLQKKIFRVAQHDFGQLRLSWQNFSVTHKKQVLRYRCSFVTGIQFLYKQVSYDLD